MAKEIDIGVKKKSGILESLGNVQIPNWAIIAIVGVTVLAGSAAFVLQRNSLGKIAADAPPLMADTADPNAAQVEVLPQITRNFNGEDDKNPFVLSRTLVDVKVAGIIINSNGRGTAILQTNDSSVIVELGDKLSGTDWSVSAIDRNGVTFSDGENEKVLMLED